ncbi:MAG: glycerol-3-phosphate 1-O-acyltransferase PlsY [Actinobacteria bacterium]|nr:glycerol-3-phosphate 1-O-acyltransferase PlsY [Actinomycetota bacterium]
MAFNRGVTTPWIIALLCIPAYFLGTFPTAVMVGKAGGHDVTAEGSGNPGASNVNRILGWRAGLIVLIADAMKGVIAASLGLAVGGRPGGWALGAAAVLGHVLPITRPGKGGKGVATTAGFLSVLYPIFALGFLVAFIIVTRVFKKASIGSLMGCICFPILVALTRPRWEAIATVALSCLIAWRHKANISRLISGNELSTKSPGS